VTILQAVFPPGAKINRDTAEVSEFHFNVSWQARVDRPAPDRSDPQHDVARGVPEQGVSEYRPTIERRVIAYVNQKLKDGNPNDSQPWLVSR
jgi:hypothetical protein